MPCKRHFEKKLAKQAESKNMEFCNMRVNAYVFCMRAPSRDAPTFWRWRYEFTHQDQQHRIGERVLWPG